MTWSKTWHPRGHAQEQKLRRKLRKDGDMHAGECGELARGISWNIA